jgi:selenophosphate synthase
MQPEHSGIIPGATKKNFAEVKIGIDRDYASELRRKQIALPQ